MYFWLLVLWSWPSHFSLDNFVEASKKAPFFTYFMNSVIAMVSSVSICAVTTILGAFVSEGGVKTGLMMATATIVVLSMIILFIFARKHIVNGVARGRLKG